jgi:hypothetical protein
MRWRMRGIRHELRKRIETNDRAHTIFGDLMA